MLKNRLASRSLPGFVLIVVLLATGSAIASAREWSDSTGKFKWDADLLVASEHTVILRSKEKELHAVAVEELSKDDQEYVSDYLAEAEKEEKPEDPEEMQTWTSRNDFKLRAKVISYLSQEISVKWKFRTVYVNDKKLSEIDAIYQMMLPKIVAQIDGEDVETDLEVKKWASQYRDKPRTFTVDGVLLRTEDGEEIVVPLFLFSDDDRSVLQAGWDKWKHEDSTEKERERENFLLQAQAAQHQQQQAAQEQRQQQIQMMQLGLLAVDSGVTSVWEVLLTSSSGGRPMRVVVPGRNSGVAREIAMQRYPGYVAGATTKVSRFCIPRSPLRTARRSNHRRAVRMTLSVR